jgi:hypothetical protein
MSCGCPSGTIVEAAPALTQYTQYAPAATMRSYAPAITAVRAAPAPAYTVRAAPALTGAIVEAAPIAVVDNRWGDYTPENIELAPPALPEACYACYQPPQVPAGQTRFLQTTAPTGLRNLQQNFNDLRTAVRENNTHIQRNKTNVTNIARNHNHLLRIVTNENNYNHFLTNNIVRVADIHRQRIENLKGETRNFKDFKNTQRVEALGCRRDGVVQVAPVPVQAAPLIAAAPAVTVAQRFVAAPAATVRYGPSAATVRYAPALTRAAGSAVWRQF